MTKKTTKKVAGARKPRATKNEEYTHIDRSNGQLLKKSQLNPDKPWLSPLSNQASIEELTQEEKDNLAAVNQ